MSTAAISTPVPANTNDVPGKLSSDIALDEMQCKLQLTENKEKLNQLRKNKRLDLSEGVERAVLTLQYNAKIFRFQRGIPLITDGKTAWGLLQSSGVIIGENLAADPYVPTIDVLKKWKLGEQAPSEDKLRPTDCHICRKPYGTFEALSAHILKHHAGVQTKIEIDEDSIRPKAPVAPVAIDPSVLAEGEEEEGK